MLKPALPAVEVFLGLPDLRPDYVAAARALSAPVMLSANAMTKRWTKEMKDNDEPHPGFRCSVPEGRLAGVRLAIDSAGFVAMNEWGEFPWSPSQYADFAAGMYACAERDGGSIAFVSSLDLCVEAEIAHDRAEVIARSMRTAALYDQTVEEFALRGLPGPMPILQGRDPVDYAISAEALGASLDWSNVPLVGLGSVCRRPLTGRDGLIAIIDELDRFLPPGPKVHLFGVKSGAATALAGHPRIASIDSQAWAMRARREMPTGRTNANTIAFAEAWLATQRAELAAAARRPSAPRQAAMFDTLSPPPAFAGWTEQERKEAAEVLHLIRNGEADLMTWFGLRLAQAGRREQNAELPMLFAA